MPILSLRDFIQQTEKRQETECRRVQVVTVRDVLEAIEANYEDDCTAEVTWDRHEPGSLAVRFIPKEEAGQ